MISFSSFSETGPRSGNEDRLLLPTRTPSGIMMAIADGVGGAPGGALAAEIAVNSLRELQPSKEQFQEVFAEIVASISKVGKEDNSLLKMATTLSAALLDGNRLSLAHVGDTRIYHLRDGGLITISQDQTELAELLRKGILTKRQAEKYTRRNVLTSALSARSEYEVFENSVSVQNSDRLLFISDGVYGQVSKSRIAEISQKCRSVEDSAEILKQDIENSGPKDNYSAIIVQVENV